MRMLYAGFQPQLNDIARAYANISTPAYRADNNVADPNSEVNGAMVADLAILMLDLKMNPFT